jgi:two-component system, cell cycle sensor histidine kinase and response regulator CckA
VARILLVDDDPMASEIIAQALQDDGHVARIAASGEQAILSLEQDGADAVVTDLSMPSLDGSQLVRFIRAHPRHAKMPVIMISGTAAHDRLAGEVDAFLQKPFRIQRLTDLLRELLPGHAA